MREQNCHCRCMNRCTGLKGVKSLGGVRLLPSQSHHLSTSKKMSLGATSWRRYPRTLAPESYTRPILGAKSIRFRWSFTNVLQQADWFCQAVPWPVYCVRYTCPIETLRRPARLLAVDMNICENLMAISKHCDRRLWRKAQVIEAQSIRYDGHVMG